MKKVRKLAGLLLALVMVLSLHMTALADDVGGTIIITNATIGQSYHVFKLFDAAVSSDGVVYTATEDQMEALKAETDNVFAFAETEAGSGVYYVSVGEDEDGNTYADEDVIEFIRSYVLQLSSTMMMCNFPGAVEESDGTENTIDGTKVTVSVTGMENGLATQSKVTFSNLPLGYYFVTSSLGTTVTLNTTRTSVEVTDKNDGEPSWDNDPADPDDPVKAVLDDAGRDINKEEVSVGDTLTYQISYTNESGETLTDITLTDKIPEHSTYVSNPASIGISFLDAAGEDVDKDKYSELGIGDPSLIYDDTTLTWSFDALPDGYTLVATFQVTVNEIDDQTTSVTIENDADLTVTLGENTYDLKTNRVENPVFPGTIPEKDVYAADTETYETGDDIDGKKVEVGDILTYQITYTNEDTDEVKLTIVDAPPAGTMYVAGSAGGTIQLSGSIDKTDITENEENSIVIAADGTITWTIPNLAAGAKVEVSFQVEVTKAALTITDSTITNSASGKIGDNEFKTNTVKNPTDDTPDPDEPGDNGKVIINADGTKSTVSTGSFGDTVTFDVSIDAVNTVENKDKSSTTQVTAYYIYDLLGAGFDLDGIEANGYITIGSSECSIEFRENTENDAYCYVIMHDGEEAGSLFTYENADGTTLIAATIYWVDDNDNALYSNCEIHLIYTATINLNAVIAGEGNQNKAIYDYSTLEDTDPEYPDPEDPKYPDSGDDVNHVYDEKTTTTYTYALAVQKISQESGVALEGAVFTLVDAGGYQIYAEPVTDINGKVLYYNYVPSGSNATNKTSEFTTNSDGQIIIKGVDIGTYTFTETQAPSGYTLLGGSVDVTTKMDSSETTTMHTSSTVTRYFEEITTETEWNGVENVYIKGTDKNGADTFVLTDEPYDSSKVYYKLVSTSTAGSTQQGTMTVKNTFDVAVTALYVENSSGSLLPSTGGMGTTIFYLVGGLLVFCAAVVLITRRRMNAR